MFGFFTACLKPVKAPEQSLLPTESRKAALNSCIFCRVSTDNGFDVVWELIDIKDGEFIAFRDHHPAAQQHLQVIPKAHIASVQELRTPDVPLVKTMKSIGNKLLDDLDISPSLRRLGFHIPPYNSVDHLHLHVQGLPYKSFFKSAKYPIVQGEGTYEKGFSWFAEVDQAIRILEKGGRVETLPC